MGRAPTGYPRSGASPRQLARQAHVANHDQLTDFLSGELDSNEAVSITTHLAHCTACATEVSTLQQTIGLLQTLPPQHASDSLRQRLLAIVAEEVGSPADANDAHGPNATGSCPPHYWLISDETRRTQQWVCHRCGKKQDHELRSHLLRTDLRPRR
jgi:anti-sigma factor RsiW